MTRQRRREQPLTKRRAWCGGAPRGRRFCPSAATFGWAPRWSTTWPPLECPDSEKVDARNRCLICRRPAVRIREQGNLLVPVFQPFALAYYIAQGSERRHKGIAGPLAGYSGRPVLLGNVPARPPPAVGFTGSPRDAVVVAVPRACHLVPPPVRPGNGSSSGVTIDSRDPWPSGARLPPFGGPCLRPRPALAGPR